MPRTTHPQVVLKVTSVGVEVQAVSTIGGGWDRVSGFSFVVPTKGSRDTPPVVSSCLVEWDAPIPETRFRRSTCIVRLRLTPSVSSPRGR